ncbi:MAG: class I SAM-dependent methyltransferase [Candidatus Omnitrophica bacterium]|nr:class I SAM-dependent methyltransferase [Candidatus Omnitrophota bacterium]
METEENKKKIKMESLLFHKASGVYFPGREGNDPAGQISYSDGAAIEGRMLRDLRKIRDVRDGSEELLKICRDWPSSYHFGPGRSNFLRAFSFPRNSKVLELGAGCGAITRYLGENFLSVDAVEGSFKRSCIARERCRDLENVRVFCSNISEVDPGDDHDLVIMSGVLEYAPLYIGGNEEEACRSLIDIAERALKPGGKLVLAIENRIGLKYWSGCPEDHTGRIYDGIHGYPLPGKAVTFTKTELSRLFLNTSFSNIDFHYCFPDYKFTSVIFSDVPSEADGYLHNWIKVPFPSYGTGRGRTFHEGLAVKTLSESGILKQFANSFAVLAHKQGKDAYSGQEWAAQSFSIMNRKESFRCVTVLKRGDHPIVEKIKLVPEACSKEHVEGVIHKTSPSPWVKGDLLIFDVYKASLGRGAHFRIIGLLKEYYQELIRRYSSGKKDEQGYDLLEGTALDFTFRNIIRGEKGWSQIDIEWVSTGMLSADYVLYRNCLNVVEALKSSPSRRVFPGECLSFGYIKAVLPGYTLLRHIRNMKDERALQRSITMGFSPESFYRGHRMVVHAFKTIMARLFG